MSTSFSEIMLLVFPAPVIPALFLKRQNLNSKNWDYLRNRIRTLDHLCSAAPKVHVVLEMILPIKKEKALLTLRCLAKAILVAFRHRLTKVGPPRKLWEFPVAANMSPPYYNHSFYNSQAQLQIGIVILNSYCFQKSVFCSANFSLFFLY